MPLPMSEDERLGDDDAQADRDEQGLPVHRLSRRLGVCAHEDVADAGVDRGGDANGEHEGGGEDPACSLLIGVLEGGFHN